MAQKKKAKVTVTLRGNDEIGYTITTPVAPTTCVATIDEVLDFIRTNVGSRHTIIWRD